MEETDELFKKFELDDTKLKNEMKNINMKRKKFASQVNMISVSDTVRYVFESDTYRVSEQIQKRLPLCNFFQAKAEQDNIERLEKVPESNKAKIEECEEMSKKMAETVEKEQTNYDEALATLQAETQEFQDKKEKLETELITLQVGCKCILVFHSCCIFL